MTTITRLTPRPLPCEHCGHRFAGSHCPLCKEPRSSFVALKNISKTTLQEKNMLDHEVPYDEKTAQVLDSAINVLGGGARVRETVKFIYALGRIDGGLALIDKQQAAVATEKAIEKAAS